MLLITIFNSRATNLLDDSVALVAIDSHSQSHQSSTNLATRVPWRHHLHHRMEKVEDGLFRTSPKSLFVCLFVYVSFIFNSALFCWRTLANQMFPCVANCPSSWIKNMHTNSQSRFRCSSLPFDSREVFLNGESMLRVSRRPFICIPAIEPRAAERQRRIRPLK